MDSSLDPRAVLAELTQVAESVGIEVHSRALRTRSLGGLCRMPGRNLVLLSSRATPHERCAVLAEALAELGHGDHPGLGPESRALVQRRGRPEAPSASSHATAPTNPSASGHASAPSHASASSNATGPGLAGGGRHGRRRI